MRLPPQRSMVGRQEELVMMPSIDIELTPPAVAAQCLPRPLLLAAGRPDGCSGGPGMEPTPYPLPHDLPVHQAKTIETLPRLRSPRHPSPHRGCLPSDAAAESAAGEATAPEPGTCAGCGDRITERYYLQAVEKAWHANCLRCVQCKLPLDSEVTCYARDGLIYCKEDYYRLFAVKRCSGCQLAISANELVMRARDCVFHMNCFTCASCHKLLITGEHFGMRDNFIYCRLHYEMGSQGDFYPPPLLDPFGPLGPGSLVPFNGMHTPVPKGRPRKRKRQQEAELDMCGQPMGLAGNENDLLGLSGDVSMQARQKRMRTSFKHHQLRIMKSYFQLNHNPDAKDLKQLAQKTGLSKRVLQVWFQNARAKHRRNLLKQDSDPKSQLGSDAGNNSSSQLNSEDSTTLTELSNAPSPAFSDNSTSHSLSEAGSRSGYMDYESSIPDYGHDPHAHLHMEHPNPCSTETSGLTELFRSSFNAMN